MDGEDYRFVSGDAFCDILNEGGFYESVEFNGNMYGTSKEEVDSKTDRTTTFLIVDPLGAIHMRQHFTRGKTLHVYLDVPPGLCEVRMLKRGDPPEKVKERLANDKAVFPKFRNFVNWDVVDTALGRPFDSAMVIKEILGL